MGRLVAAEAWTTLQAGKGAKGVTRQRVAPEAPIDVFLAVEHPTGVRLVTFGVPTAELLAHVEVPSASGVEIRAVPSATGEGWGHVEVRLADIHYGELFSALVDDVVQYVEIATNVANAIDRLADRLRRWEAFLELVPPGGLSHERRAGLYGELHVLRSHLIPLNQAAAVNAWVGPMGAHQDFQTPRWALEVKTSRTKVPVSVRISGERQLDDLGLSFLALAHIGLEQKRNSGETLPEMVASVRDLVADSPEAEPFEALLFAAGYLAIHEKRYMDDGYVVRFDEVFRVRDGFPRLTERDLPSGVGSVAYTVDVSALSEFRITWADIPSVAQLGSDSGTHQ